ncbi:hypothetical protein KI387_027775, partial [Taxus chinensis]
APYAPAMFVFGDSLADAGNNNFISGCTVRANFTPYGISFFPRPTGRFTNGRTAFDFVATYLRLPFPPPFLELGAKFSFGINFASAGSGLLDSTGNSEVLYTAGARKFVLADISAIGCTPYARNFGYIAYGGKCVDLVNQLVVKYNIALRRLVDHLNQNLDGMSIVLLNSYDYIMNIIKHSESYGFSEIKKACCGSGRFNVEVACGKTTPPGQYCKDPNAYLFWDQVHPTQKTCANIAHEMWIGNSSVMHPFNLFTLIFGSN